MDAYTVTALFGTMLVLSATPGPSDFAVVSTALTAGFRQASYMVLGIVAADLLFIIFAVSSLSVIAERFSSSFLAIKLAAGSYLLWLGVSQFRLKPDDKVAHTHGTNPGYSNMGAGFLITLSDPKAILFYMGLLPAFIDMTAVTIANALLIMLIATVVICSVKLSYAYLAERATVMFQNDRLRQRLNLAASLVLIGTGLFIIQTVLPVN